MREVAERVDQHERRLGRHLAQALPARRRGDGAQQLLAGALDAIDRPGRERTLRVTAGALDVRREAAEARPRDPAAEPRGRRLLEPVCLVEDHRVVLGQHTSPGGDVREVERVVDDHEVGRRGALARVLGEARRDEGAAAPRTAVGPDCQLAPERLGRLDRELGAVAGVGGVEEALHRLPRAGVAPVGEQERLEALQLATAEVVRAAFQHLDANSAAERGGGDRDVLREQLLLERLGGGGDDNAPPRLERRYEIGEALPDSGAGLGDEMLPVSSASATRAASAACSLLGSYSGSACASAPPGPKTSSILWSLRERTDVPTVVKTAAKGAISTFPPAHAVDDVERRRIGCPTSDPVGLRTRWIRHSAPVGLRTRRG